MRERQADIHYARHGNASIRRTRAPAQNDRQQENHHHADCQDRKQFFHVAEPRATLQQNQRQCAENIRRDNARTSEYARKFMPRQKRQKYREPRERRAAVLNHERRDGNSYNSRDNSQSQRRHILICLIVRPSRHRLVINCFKLIFKLDDSFTLNIRICD